MVVVANDSRITPTGIVAANPAGRAMGRETNPPDAGDVGRVAEVVDMPPIRPDGTVEPAGISATVPVISQSPAVSEIDVTFSGTAVVADTADPDGTVALIYSPTWPVSALSFVVVPVRTKAVVAICVVPAAAVAATVGAAGVPVNAGDARCAYGVRSVVNPAPETVPDAASVVNAPVLAAVDPIGPGDARSDVKPAPEIAPDAARVVNAPVLATVEPIGLGDANRDANPLPDTAPETDRVVNAPVLGAVEPIGLGEASRATNPVPDTAPEADNVVNAAVFGVTLPIGPGDVRVDSASAVLSVICTPPVGVTRA